MTHCPDGLTAVLVRSLLSSAILKILTMLFLCCHFKTLLPNCQHLLLCSRQVLVLQNEKWNLFWTTPRVPEIAFIQLVSIQLTCENQSALIPCQRWAMSYDENTEAHFLSGSLVNQFHTLMDIDSLSLECVYKIHLSWHSGRMVLEPKYFVQILELLFSRCLSISVLIWKMGIITW